MSDSLRSHGLYSPWNSLGNTGVGSHSLLRGFVQPTILEWIAYPFYSGSSQPRSMNWSLLYCRQILYLLNYQGSPVAYNYLQFLQFFFPSDQFRCSVMNDSLWLHRLQHARLPCLSPTPGACTNSCASSQWFHPTNLSSVIPLSFWYSLVKVKLLILLLKWTST